MSLRILIFCLGCTLATSADESPSERRTSDNVAGARRNIYDFYDMTPTAMWGTTSNPTDWWKRSHYPDYWRRSHYPTEGWTTKLYPSTVRWRTTFNPTDWWRRSHSPSDWLRTTDYPSTGRWRTTYYPSTARWRTTYYPSTARWRTTYYPSTARWRTTYYPSTARWRTTYYPSTDRWRTTYDRRTTPRPDISTNAATKSQYKNINVIFAQNLFIIGNHTLAKRSFI